MTFDATNAVFRATGFNLEITGQRGDAVAERHLFLVASRFQPCQ
jgi:hypothetical protein